METSSSSENKILFLPAPIEQFLCQWFKVNHISQVKPYGQNTVAPGAFTLVRDSYICVKSSFTGTLKGEEIVDMEMTPTDPSKIQPKDPFIHTKTGKPCVHDLTNVMIVNFNVRHYKFISKTKRKLGIRLNFDHEHLAKFQETNIHEKVVADSGGIPGIFRALDPTDENGADITNAFPIFEAGFGFTNSEFTRTMALLTEKNIKTGIIEIPKQVCLDARLPVRGLNKDPNLTDDELTKMFEGLKMDNVEEEKEKARRQVAEQFQKDIENLSESHVFFAVPENHILSWPFKCRDFCQENHVNFETLDLNGKPIYYLVPEIYFKSWVQRFSELWLNKCDKRSLTSIGMQMLAIGAEPEELNQVSVEITNYIHYWTYPTGLNPENVDRLLPLISPNFPTADNWCMTRVPSMIKQYEEEEGKIVGSKKMIKK